MNTSQEDLNHSSSVVSLPLPTLSLPSTTASSTSSLPVRNNVLASNQIQSEQSYTDTHALSKFNIIPPPLAKFKFRGSYNSAKKHINKLINKSLIPSFLTSLSLSENTEIPSSSSSSPPSHSSQPSTSRLNGSKSVPNFHNLDIPNPPFVALRRRQDSISTQSIPEDGIAVNDDAASGTNSYLSAPYFTQHDNSSTASGIGMSLSRVSSWASSTSGMLFGNQASANSTTHRPPGHHSQTSSNASSHQLKSQRSLFFSGVIGDGESGVAFNDNDEVCLKSKLRRDFVEILPIEVVENILSYLSAKDLCACALVSKSWKLVSEGNSLWRNQYLSHSPYWDVKPEYLPNLSVKGANSSKGKTKLGKQPAEAPNLNWKTLYKVRFLLDKRWEEGEATPIAIRGHLDSVYCVHFNDEIIATGSRDNTIKIWNANTGSLMKVLGQSVTQFHTRENLPNMNNDSGAENNNNDITVVNGSQQIAASEPTSSSVNNNSEQSSNQQNFERITGHSGSVVTLHFDDTLMVSGSSDCTFIVWDLTTFRAIKRVHHHEDGLLGICIDKWYIATCSKDSTIAIWDRTQCRLGNPTVPLLYQLRGHRGPVNAIDMKNGYLASAGGDGVIKLWAIGQGPDPPCKIFDYRDPAKPLLFSPLFDQEYARRPLQIDDDRTSPSTIIPADSNAIKDFYYPKPVCNFLGHTRGLACVQIYPDMLTIASGGNDQTIRMWDVASGECRKIIDAHRDLVRSLHFASGRLISGSYDLSIKVWDAQTGKRIAVLKGLFGSWIFTAKADCKKIIATSFGIKPLIYDFSDGLDKSYLKVIKS